MSNCEPAPRSFGRAFQFPQSLPISNDAIRDSYSLRQYLLEKLQSALVAGLAEPEHRLLAHRRFWMSPGDLDQKRYCFVLRALADREHRLFLHFGVVVGFLNNVAQHLEAAFACPLSEPEQCLLS